MEYTKNYENIKLRVLELIENSIFKNCISLIEVEFVLPSNHITKKFTIEGRVSKKLLVNLKNGWLNPLDELEESIYETISSISGPKIATTKYEEYWLVKIGVSKNDIFKALVVNKLEGGQHTIKQEGNETLVIDIWATWCTYCQVPMEHNMKLMKTIEIVESNIKIIGVSCDANLEDLKSHIETKGWNQIPQYNQVDVRTTLDILSIPCVIIINKQSIIKYVGSPNNMKFEESLLSICQGGEAIIDHYDHIEDNVWFSKLNDEQKKDFVNNINNNLEHFGCKKATFVMSSVNTYEGLTLKSAKCKPAFLGKILSEEMAMLKEFEQKKLKGFNLFNPENKCQIEEPKVLVINTDEDF